MNIIRNWMGNNYEEQFYDLADENGMMILNDFWQSTQNYQIEPEDPQLFLKNARDVISALSQPSLDRGVVRPQRRRALSDAQRRAGRSRRASSTARAGTPAARTASNCRDQRPV